MNLTQVPAAASFGTDREATEAFTDQRTTGFPGAPRSEASIPVGISGDTRAEAIRYDADVVDEATRQKLHAVGLSRVFLEPEPTVWQAFFTCAPDDFDEARLQETIELFPVVGDVELSLDGRG